MELLNPNDFIKNVKECKQIILERLDKAKTNLNITESINVPLEFINLSDIQDKLLSITFSLHKKYVFDKKLPHLTLFETSKFLLDAKLVALAGVISLLRHAYEIDKNFEQIYKDKIGLEFDNTVKKDILLVGLAGKGINTENKEDELLDLFVLEGGLPYSLLTYQLKFSFIYFKYFYPIYKIEEIISSNNLYLEKITQEQDRNEFKYLYNKLKIFKTKLVQSVYNFIKILTSWNISVETDINRFLDNFEFSIIYSLNNSNEAREELYKLLQNITLKKLEKINNEVYYGEYKINDNFTFKVTPHPTISLEELINFDCNKLIKIGNKIFYKSKYEFNVYDDYSFKYKYHKLNDFYLFYYELEPQETLFIEDSNKIYEVYLENNCNWDTSFYYYYNETELEHEIRYTVNNICLNSKQNSNNTIEIINSDYPKQIYSFTLNKQGVGYAQDLDYKINNKKPLTIDLLLFDKNKKSIVKLEQNAKATQSKLNFNPYYKTKKSINLDKVILFSKATSLQIKSNREPYKFGDTNFILFTTKEIKEEWFNEAIDFSKIKSLKKWGEYFVYELTWDDITQNLIIDIDGEHQWIFENPLTVNFIPQKTSSKIKHKEYCNGKLILDLDNNQYFSFKELRIKLNIKPINLLINNLLICIYHNDKLIAETTINNILNDLDRNISNLIIDEEIIQYLTKYIEPKIGKYTICITDQLQLDYYSLSSNILNSYTFYVLPELTFEEYSKQYLEGEQLAIFYKIKEWDKQKYYKFTDIAKINSSLQINKKSKVENLEPKHIKQEPQILYESINISPFINKIYVKYMPNVIGTRFASIKENINPYITDRISYYELDNRPIIVFGADKSITISYEDNKREFACNKNITVIPLSFLKDELKYMNNNINIEFLDKKLEFVIEWYPQVTKFIPVDIYTFKIYPYFSLEEGLSFSISYCAPPNSVLKFKLEDINANPINIENIYCDKVKNPSFIKYNGQTNTVELICDGLNWEDRLITFILPHSVINKELLILKGYYAYSNEPFSTELVFYNSLLNEEVIKLTQQIFKNPESSNNYYKRGLYFKEKGLNYLALNDFEKAKQLGIKSKKSMLEIEEFSNKVLPIILEEKIKFLTQNTKKVLLEQFNLDLE